MILRFLREKVGQRQATHSNTPSPRGDGVFSLSVLFWPQASRIDNENKMFDIGVWF